MKKIFLLLFLAVTCAYSINPFTYYWTIKLTGDTATVVKWKANNDSVLAFATRVCDTFTKVIPRWNWFSNHDSTFRWMNIDTIKGPVNIDSMFGLNRIQGNPIVDSLSGMDFMSGNPLVDSIKGMDNIAGNPKIDSIKEMDRLSGNPLIDSIKGNTYHTGILYCDSVISDYSEAANIWGHTRGTIDTFFSTWTNISEMEATNAYSYTGHFDTLMPRYRDTILVGSKMLFETGFPLYGDSVFSNNLPTSIKMIDGTNDTLNIIQGGKTWKFVPVADQ